MNGISGCHVFFFSGEFRTFTIVFILSFSFDLTEGRTARNHLLCSQPERHDAPAADVASSTDAGRIRVGCQVHGIAGKEVGKTQARDFFSLCMLTAARSRLIDGVP